MQQILHKENLKTIKQKEKTSIIYQKHGISCYIYVNIHLIIATNFNEIFLPA